MLTTRPSRVPPTLVLALSLLPTARANCVIDDDGFEHCTLSTGARIGIAVALIIVALLAASCAIQHRRRRMQTHIISTNSYANAQNVNYPPNGYPSPYSAPQQPYAPQYPPQALHDGYNPQAGFAPPQGPPPGYYPPPPGPPPMNGKEDSV
ncbi:uncharacterized protein PHACADRAFT_263411 [Phanerochaete carnosa HHB-10118-sp]|uniref:Uncharacterized protein n=1 Tax=Phanerochaete carnosa (strain HHB-10118-sp) TaxID=650164 RepID=K5UNN0_PHACS|nr:uncharacterized protein PHACADRAFT_263411 [Phanerochaete carnosa HHB-10118-sp]EKM51346.1 hypothetical protein PHACADRAFT_263411 [Phanerochaete carnosa HHB-10118-sp]